MWQGYSRYPHSRRSALQRHCRRGDWKRILAGPQPDSIGERFTLDRLSADGVAGLNSRLLLQAAWTFQPHDVRVVAVRSASDFHGDQKPALQAQGADAQNFGC